MFYGSWDLLGGRAPSRFILGLGRGSNYWWVVQIRDGRHSKKDESLVPVLTLAEAVLKA
jgi:hypothetical protein